jgi:quinol monooxygenase YgiN
MASVDDQASADEFANLRAGEPVISVVKLRIAATDVADLLARSVDVLTEESRELDGFLGGQVLASLDEKTFVVLTEWRDRHAWSQSRYDVRIGKIIERFHEVATGIEFELYTRRKQFPAPPA